MTDILPWVITIACIYLFVIKEVSLQSTIKHAKTFYEKLSKSLNLKSTIKHTKTFYEKLSKSLTLTGFSNRSGNVEYGKISIFTIIITIVIFLVGFELITGNYSSSLAKTGLVAMFFSSGTLIFHIIYEIFKRTFRVVDIDEKIAIGCFALAIVATILSSICCLYQHEIFSCTPCEHYFSSNVIFKWSFKFPHPLRIF